MLRKLVLAVTALLTGVGIWVAPISTTVAHAVPAIEICNTLASVGNGPFYDSNYFERSALGYPRTHVREGECKNFDHTTDMRISPVQYGSWRVRDRGEDYGSCHTGTSNPDSTVTWRSYKGYPGTNC